MKFLLSDILGYIGSMCLALRFVPILQDYYQTQMFPFNSWLVLLEFSADMLLGTSGVLIGSHPMVVSNGICLLVISSLYLHHRWILYKMIHPIIFDNGYTTIDDLDDIV